MGYFLKVVKIMHEGRDLFTSQTGSEVILGIHAETLHMIVRQGCWPSQSCIQPNTYLVQVSWWCPLPEGWRAKMWAPKGEREGQVCQGWRCNSSPATSSVSNDSIKKHLPTPPTGSFYSSWECVCLATSATLPYFDLSQRITRIDLLLSCTCDEQTSLTGLHMSFPPSPQARAQ